MKTIKKLLAVMLICIQTLQFSMVPNVLAEETATTPGTEQTSDTAVEVTAPSAILMEMTTGTVLYEKDADTARPPASVTKVMTMLLIFDALAEGKIQLEDEVTTSECLFYGRLSGLPGNGRKADRRNFTQMYFCCQCK